MTKEEIRKTIQTQRLNLLKTEREEKSKLIVQKIIELSDFQESKNILIYYPIQNEVSLLELFKKEKQNKNFFLPTIRNNKIEINRFTNLETILTGKYKIPESEKETTNKETIDLCLIPAIAFDKEKNRIGFGKGYYDQFLKTLNTKKIGIAYDFQIVQKIPTHIHDVRMDKIITESCVI